MLPVVPVHDVCFGSLADIGEGIRDVRFTPKSGRSQPQYGCPLSAKSGHQSRRNPSGWSARCLDFADIEETRPRAEDASRVPRRADHAAECDLAEVSPEIDSTRDRVECLSNASDPHIHDHNRTVGSRSHSRVDGSWRGLRVSEDAPRIERTKVPSEGTNQLDDGSIPDSALAPSPYQNIRTR